MSQRCKNKNIENIEKTTHKQLTNQFCTILFNLNFNQNVRG